MSLYSDIEDEIERFYKAAKPGTTEFTLPSFNQNDVVNVVNSLHSQHPRHFDGTSISMENIAEITIHK